MLVGDCREVLRALPAKSAHACVTSPPYWGLRDYGEEGQIGREKTLEEYVRALVEVFREVRRVLRDDGVLWLNLGDSYMGAGDSNHDKGAVRGARREEGGKNWHNRARGLADGNLAGTPWRVALALQADGWLLRSDVCWSKLNVLPESVAGWRWERCRRKVGSRRSAAQGYAGAGGHRDKTHGNLEEQASVLWEDCPGCGRCEKEGGFVLRRGSWRPTRAHEYVFMLAKSPGYYSAGEWVREPSVGGHGSGQVQRRGNWQGGRSGFGTGVPWSNVEGGRNLRDVWSLSSQPSALRHFAMMPPALVEKCLLASCPARCCAGCGAAYAPVKERGVQVVGGDGYGGKWEGEGRQSSGWRLLAGARAARAAGRGHDAPFSAGRVVAERATCGCELPHGAGTEAGLVLDPFLGAGTVAAVAEVMGRRWVGAELSGEYAGLVPARVAEVAAYYERRAGKRVARVRAVLGGQGEMF